MVNLNIIKNDDLKELSACVYENHIQLKNLSILNILGKEFKGKGLTNNIQKIDLKSCII